MIDAARFLLVHWSPTAALLQASIYAMLALGVICLRLPRFSGQVAAAALAGLLMNLSLQTAIIAGRLQMIGEMRALS